MAISFVAAGAIATGANATVALPAGYAQTDMLVLMVSANLSVTTPSGWTVIATDASNPRIYLFYKFAGNSETSVTLASASTATKGVMMAYRGVSRTDKINASAGATGTTISTSAMTTAYANEFVVSAYIMDVGTATWTAPASTTTRVNSSSTASINGLLLVDELQATAGAVTVRTATSSVSKALGVASFSIIPSGRYWVGGGASWDGTISTKWSFSSGGASGAPVPTIADPVFFDAASGANAVTINAGNTGAASINCTGFTGNLTGNSPISVAGSVTLVSGMVCTYTGTLTLTASGTLTPAGKTLGTVTTAGDAGSTFTLGGALTLSAILNIQNGTFNTTASNYAITAPLAQLGYSGTTSLSLNASTITITGTGFSVSSGITLSAGTSTINLTAAVSDFTGGGKTYNNVSFTGAAADGNHSINGANTFNTLTIEAPTSDGVSRFAIDSNQTITTLVCAGASAVRRIALFSDVIGTARTLTVGTYTTKTDVDFRNITAAGASAPWSGTRLGNCGGNTSITFDAAKTVYWNLTGTQNWSATAWATTSGGTPASTNFPLAQDTAVFNNTGAATTVNIANGWNIGSVTMSARTSAMTLSVTSPEVYVYGNFTVGTGVTLDSSSADNALTFAGASAQTITSAGKVFANRLSMEGTSLTLQDAYNSSSNSLSLAINLVRGTLNANNYNVTLSQGALWSTGTTVVRALAMGSGTWTIGGLGTSWNTSSGNLTVTGTGTLSFTSASAKSFQGGGNYSGITINQGGAGALTIVTSNTYANISNTYSTTGATTITFAQSQTVSNFTATGEPGRVLTINSNINGTARTLTKSSGVVSVDYLSIRDSTAAGGASWYAGANSTNVSNNTGWIFSVPAVSNFFLMFM